MLWFVKPMGLSVTIFWWSVYRICLQWNQSVIHKGYNKV